MSPTTRPLWWQRSRQYSVPELVADGVVHVLGLLVAISAGSVLLAYALTQTAQSEFFALVVYVASLVCVLSVSLAYNLWPPLAPAKKHLARLDQAAIFLFIAGSYTPFLAIMGGTPTGNLISTLIWGASLVGVALKLIVPQRFGRLAILLYLAIGWSGVLVFKSLANILSPTALWLLLAGGIVYSAGILFHVWEKLQFHNVLWHVFVVTGASLHLLAIMDAMVISRL